MIDSLAIKNFKTVVDLKLDLGQFNVFIGENGCGKSNILEGIAFGAAAASNKLDYEFFANRGIRVTEPRFMFPAFEDTAPEYIDIFADYGSSGKEAHRIFYDTSSKPPRWVDKVQTDTDAFIGKIKEEVKHTGSLTVGAVVKLLGKDADDDAQLNIKIEHRDGGLTLRNQSSELSPYLIYSLEESKLRRFDIANRIYPLGRNGEGLFAYLKEIAQKENGVEILSEIKENLSVLDWFDNLEIPASQLSNEFVLRVKDRFISDTLSFFDQRSTNEGFLYLLFYLTLFISDETPSFFAIDNIESSFNPKLCREVVRRLKMLAVKHHKQVIATTHNPSVLDGLDIADERERLYVVRRNLDGFTKANRIVYKTETSGLPLSEAWVNGYLGGLPDNF